MDVPLEIAFRHLDSSPAVEARVREQVKKLEHYYERLVSCRVTIEVVSDHHRKGPKYRVTVEANVSGPAVVIAKGTPGEEHLHDDIYIAIRDAFDAAKRQLQDHATKLRDEARQPD